MSKLFSHEQILEKKNEIQNQIKFYYDEIEKVQSEIEQLDVSDRIKVLQDIVDKMDKVPNAKEEHANELLKTFIKKVHYHRPVPDEMLHLHSNSKERRNLPFKIGVELYE